MKLNYSCCAKSEFVGMVRDPSEPLLAAQQLGREIFARKFSNFSIDTQRSAKV